MKSLVQYSFATAITSLCITPFVCAQTVSASFSAPCGMPAELKKLGLTVQECVLLNDRIRTTCVAPYPTLAASASVAAVRAAEDAAFAKVDQCATQILEQSTGGKYSEVMFPSPKETDSQKIDVFALLVSTFGLLMLSLLGARLANRIVGEKHWNGAGIFNWASLAVLFIVGWARGPQSLGTLLVALLLPWCFALPISRKFKNSKHSSQESVASADEA